MAAATQKTYTLKDSVSFSLTVGNTGSLDADEVVQAYIEYPTGDRMPIRELKAFRRVTVPAQNSKTVSLSIPATELQKWDLATGKWKLYKGEYRLVLGSNSGDQRLTASFTAR
ncbi:fibronectin type III-like domain-contianing protein [Puia sp. P3]|uniref:fibronectin type III-like domain-contianing protein n=1 Tax=Puia sp. P3 TaxID=3423952 RepID=UPI003D664E57